MRLALIDDASIARTLFTRIATAAAYDVVIVPQSEPVDLTRAVEAIDPDLIVLDGRYADPLGIASEPASPAIALVGALRERLPRVALAIVASFGETVAIRRAAAAGAGFVIPRPFQRASVLVTLAAMANERARALR